MRSASRPPHFSKTLQTRPNELQNDLIRRVGMLGCVGAKICAVTPREGSRGHEADTASVDRPGWPKNGTKGMVTIHPCKDA